MPKFEFKSPEGKTYVVNGPEGSTPEQAWGVLQQQLNVNLASKPASDVPDTNYKQPAPPPEPGFADKAMGVGETAAALGTGIVAPAIGAYSAVKNAVLNPSQYQGKNYSARVDQFNQDYTRAKEQATYSPKTETGQEYTRKTAQALGTLPPLPEIPMAASTSRRAASSVAQSAGKAGKAVAKTVGEIADPLLPNFATKLTPEMQALNAKARKIGVVFTPDQLSNNKYARVAGEGSRNVPLAGGRATENQAAWERALANTLGIQGDRVTPKGFDSAMRRYGVQIDAITRKYGFTFDEDVTNRFASHIADVQNIETPEVQSTVRGFVNELFDKSKDGKVDGAAFRRWNSKLGAKIRGTNNGDLKNALSDLQDIALEKFNDGVTNKNDAKALYDARVRYAQLKTVAPIVGDPKGVSPPKLLSAVRNSKATKELYARGRLGEMGDLADIGQLLKDPNTSMTAERALMLGAPSAVIGGAAAANIPAAAGIWAGANLYNRTSPYFIRPKQ